MTDEIFTASNGIIVTIDSRGCLIAKGGRDGMTSYATAGAQFGVQALREYFQHKRDQQLGRWRDPENPDFVVYPTSDKNRVRVVNESSGFVLEYRRKFVVKYVDDYFTATVAKRYFEAHPETKPWHNAKPGEVWLITVDEHTPELALVLDNRPGIEFSNAEGLRLPVTNPEITHAEKIYPREENQ